jgi:hypothetical protein
VDVNVEGVAKRQTTALEKEATSEESMADIVRAQTQRAEATEVNSFEKQLANLRDVQDFELLPEEEPDERQLRLFEED